MTVYEQVDYTPAGPDDDGFVYLRDPYLARLVVGEVLIGDAVTEDGVPAYGKHSSARVLLAAAVTGRRPLRLDPDRGLVVPKLNHDAEEAR